MGTLKKVFMIGGTGLLGSAGARELIAHGYEVATLSLPPIPPGEQLPPEMTVTLGNYLEMADDELRECFRGCDGFVFAAGVDERVEGPPPIYDLFKKYNIDALERLLRLAKESGVRHTVVFGSYFAYFERTRPAQHLAQQHPYIRSRRDQETMALSFADDDFSVAVLELPYIFGTQPGRKPVWVFLVESVRAMKRVTLYPKGGTTMVTVRQVAQATVGALERTEGGAVYPIGWFNMTWPELLAIVHKYVGTPGKRVITIPTWMYQMGGRKIRKQQRAAGHEGGLDMVRFADLQTSLQFIDKSEGALALGVTDDDIAAAIGESVTLSVKVLDGRAATIDMRGE
ncbi:NAD-dependent epimerase/dehydratase family protein [Microbacterium sp. NPDC056044]|uniref:NAD-dependent epimerase/dehydratase family protein n=1 Tax=Microbacterium sp. NPDC056044 TaxID=3345690 RepID=UPI0035DD69D8